MNYPAAAQIDKASADQLREWWSKLGQPSTDSEVLILAHIKERILSTGQKLPRLSQAVGNAKMTVQQFKAYQRELRCSDHDLAHLLGCRPDTVQAIKNGRKDIPRFMGSLLPLLAMLDRDDCTIAELRKIAKLVDEDNLRTVPSRRETHG